MKIRTDDDGDNEMMIIMMMTICTAPICSCCSSRQNLWTKFASLLVNDEFG